MFPVRYTYTNMWMSAWACVCACTHMVSSLELASPLEDGRPLMLRAKPRRRAPWRGSR